MNKISNNLLARSHLIGIFTGEIPIAPEMPFIKQIWQKLQLCFESNSSSCCYVIKPQNTYLGTISIYTKQLAVGDSMTELTVGPRMDKILEVDLAFEFKKYSDIDELGHLEPAGSKNKARLDQILKVFNQRLLRHEFSHAKVALLNVVHVLTEQGLTETPLKIDTLAEYEALHYLMEEIQRCKQEVGELEDLIPNILDYIEVQEELAQLGLRIKFYESEVRIPTGKHLTTKLPIIVDKEGQRLLVITKTDFVAMAHFVQKRKITREWFARYKKLPIFDLDPDLLDEFRQIYHVNFQIDKIGKRIKSAKFHPETSLAAKIDKNKSVTTHRLPTKINLITISQFAKAADFRICVGEGLLKQNLKFQMGNTIYHTTYEHIGAYIFASKNRKKFAYAFYEDEKMRKKIKEAVNHIHIGDVISLCSAVDTKTCLPTLMLLQINNKTFIT